MRRLTLALALGTLLALVAGAWLTWINGFDLTGLLLPSTADCLLLVLSAVALAWGLARLRLVLPLAQALSTAAAVVLILAAAHGRLYAGDPAWELRWIAAFVDALVRGGGDGTSARVLVLVGAVLWWRGTRLGTEGHSAASVRRMAAFAIGAVAALAIVARVVHPVDLGPAVAGGFVATLVAFSLVQVEDASMGYDGMTVDLGGQWAFLLAAAIAVAALPALALAMWLSLSTLRGLLRPFEPAAVALLRLGVVVFGVLFNAIFPLIEAVVHRLVALIQAFTQQLVARPRPPAGPPDHLPILSPVSSMDWSTWLTWLVMALAVVALIGWLTRAYRRYNDRAPDALSTERASALSWGRIGADAWHLLRSALGAVGDAVRGLGGRQSGVRRLYAELLALAAVHGAARGSSETPYEYRPAAERMAGTAASDVAALTEAYVVARYGQREPDPARWRLLAAAWERIRRAAGAA
jgi:hypothetical protein